MASLTEVEACLARHERDFSPAQGKPLELDELLSLLERKSPSREPECEGARACYLSSSEGWREAVKHLGGAFADGLVPLTDAQEE